MRNEKVLFYLRVMQDQHITEYAFTYEDAMMLTDSLERIP